MLKKLQDVDFWDAALTRAVRTFFQTFISTIGVAQVLSDVNWQLVFSASILAAVISLATSFVTGLPEVDSEE